MKKWIIGVCLLSLLSLISVYFFIPSTIVVTKSIMAKANQAGVYRFISDESNWQKWWPVSSSSDKDSKTGFESEGYRFKKIKPLFNAFEISIAKNEQASGSLLQLFSLGKDSTKITWSVSINTGINPFRRIQCFLKAKELGNTLEGILASMKEYISNVQHIYGIDIKEEKVQIEFMVSTKKTFPHYPGTGDIYEMLDQIKKYITQLQGKEEDYPMMHINISDSTSFGVQVAIPVSKQLPDGGIFSSKRMLKHGNILVTEITGGKNTVDYGMRQVEQYLSDHQYSNVALPFQSLITDRRKETDTSKWVTKIYYPIR